MTIGDDDKIKPLPVKFKGPLPPDRTLLAPYEVASTDGYTVTFHEKQP